MIHAKTTAVGCAEAKCNNKATAACFYNQPELQNGELIYTKGTPCRTADECTTYQPSTCDNGFCVKGDLPTTPAGSSSSETTPSSSSSENTTPSSSSSEDTTSGSTSSGNTTSNSSSSENTTPGSTSSESSNTSSQSTTPSNTSPGNIPPENATSAVISSVTKSMKPADPVRDALQTRNVTKDYAKSNVLQHTSRGCYDIFRRNSNILLVLPEVTMTFFIGIWH
ncbi:hypothetical protein ANCCAN_01712 [Ancylostoma caninum]|uniref:SCP domain-containing protein n=1 Tax=Ancylostoma caninum TaxID=29170 RepID=A0A368H9H4_ANCCA|nr:hypothetical protein ANCCAN_01712 [Ancylostoma caninum]